MKAKKVKPVLVGIKGYVEQYPFLGLNDNKLSLYTNENPSNFNVIPQELIFISLEDEKIEVSDKYLDDCGLIRKAVTSNEDYWKRRPNYKKVITRQSQISPEYISKFIKQYNDGCVEDLEIEMNAYTNKYKCCKKDMKVELPETIVCNICGAKGIDIINGVKNLITHYIPKLTNGFITIVEKES